MSSMSFDLHKYKPGYDYLLFIQDISVVWYLYDVLLGVVTHDFHKINVSECKC